jgi:uncharacterized protein
MKDLDKRRKIVMLTITEDCNLNCIYCFENAKTKKAMDFQVAKQIIDYEFKNSADFDEIEFDLFGGEPTLYINFIKDIVKWTHGQDFKKPYLFFLETNGTLVHGEFQNWLIQNKEFVYAGLSLDGTSETHNFNRSNSYRSIDVGFFVKTYPDQSVRMTINNKTIRNLSNDIIHLHRLGFSEIVSTFAYGVNWDFNEIKDVLEYELKKLCDFYLENPELKECSIFDMNLPAIIQKGQIIEKWCGTGTTMVSYGIDGTQYPCHVFQPNTTAKSKANDFGEIDFKIIKDFSDPECSKCIIESICPNCYGMNYLKDGNFLSRDKQLCEIVKTRALATSYLIAQQIERKHKHLSPNNMFQTIDAIKEIQTNLLIVEPN